MAMELVVEAVVGVVVEAEKILAQQGVEETILIMLAHHHTILRQWVAVLYSPYS